MSELTEDRKKNLEFYEEIQDELRDIAYDWVKEFGSGYRDVSIDSVEVDGNNIEIVSSDVCMGESVTDYDTMPIEAYLNPSKAFQDERMRRMQASADAAKRRKQEEEEQKKKEEQEEYEKYLELQQKYGQARPIKDLSSDLEFNDQFSK